MGIESGGDVRAVVPSITIAGGDSFNSRGAVVDSQVQSDGTVTACRIEG